LDDNQANTSISAFEGEYACTIVNAKEFPLKIAPSWSTWRSASPIIRTVRRRRASEFRSTRGVWRLWVLGNYGELLRYVRSSAGKGFTAEAGSRDDIMTSAPPGDPCCEWYFDEDSMQWICIAWC
jgi:hypothetical protein